MCQARTCVFAKVVTRAHGPNIFPCWSLSVTSRLTESNAFSFLMWTLAESTFRLTYSTFRFTNCNLSFLILKTFSSQHRISKCRDGLNCQGSSAIWMTLDYKPCTLPRMRSTSAVPLVEVAHQGASAAATPLILSGAPVPYSPDSKHIARDMVLLNDVRYHTHQQEWWEGWWWLLGLYNLVTT
jgi:hypothetical protein